MAIFRSEADYDKHRLPYYLLRRLKWWLGDRSPLLAYLKVTNRCNLDCYYCPWHTSARDYSEELSTEQWKTIITAIIDAGAQVLVFEGGEPTLREDLTELLAHAHAQGAITIVATNGLGQPWRFQPTAFTVSIDGPERYHDSIRGQGTYSKICANLQARQERVAVAITVLTSRNIPLIESFLEETAGLVDSFLFTFVYPYQSKDLVPLDLSEISVARATLLRAKDKYSILNPSSSLSKEAGKGWTCHDQITVAVNHKGEIQQGCFVGHKETRECQTCNLSCFQFLSALHDFNFEAWFNIHRLFKLI